MERELNFIESSLKESNLSVGLESLQRLLSKYKSSQESLQIILERLYSLGQKFMKEKSFRIIFPLFQILSKLCQILQDSARLCDIKNSLSFCYRNTGQVNLALKECLEALEIAGEAKGLVGKLSALHINACAIYREDVKDLKIAKTHAELAYFFAKENCNLNSDKDKRTLAVACYNYGIVLEEMKDRTNALVWYKEGLKFCEEKWEDLYMEQVFREKVSTLSNNESSKKNFLGKKRTASQKPSVLKKYNFSKELAKFSQRPKTNKNRSTRGSKKYSLTPISGKTLPIHSINLEKTSFYQEIEPEYRVKTRNSNTPSTSIKNQRLYTETYSNPPKPKLSLVQSVIKIQKWYRKLFKRPKISLKNEYLTLGIKIFYGVNYFFSVFKSSTGFEIEAWPLVRQIKKPENLPLTLETLCENLNLKDNSKDSIIKHSKLLNQIISVNNGSITISKLTFLFTGPYAISNKSFTVSISHHNRNLEIEASSQSETLTCSVKLDPLQDLTNLKSKLDLILENLSIQSGILLFNLT